MTINYLGKYDNLSLLWEAHPNGGIEGEYCYVGDQLLVWDKYENDWVEGSAEVLDVIPSEQPERESNNGLNCIGYFESEQQLWSQHPQGGVEGDYVVIAGKEYIWDKYNKEWREATEEDAAHFTAAVIVQDEAYEYSRLAITFMGSFENVSQIWKVYPQGGIEGGYIYLGEDKYIWDKYSYSWKPFEPTESSKLRPIDVTYTEGVVAYSEDYINYIGTFDNLDQVWEMYPNGGKDGDYILVNGERLKWNKYTSNWGEDESGDTSPARSVATIYGDLHVFNDLVIGENLYARILEELSKKQWVQDNFTTKQWLLDQNYARQEWVLGQYEVLQDWVDQRNADIAKWILERNYISEGDISSETVMNLIETDEITITKKDGVLVAIASGGQGSVPIITTKDVNAIPSDQNVFSAAKAVATFLDTTKGGTVLEPVNFEKGIRIGGKDGIEIIYDIENNALCFGGNAYSLGGMTAGGVGSGGSGGGGGISYNRLDSWSDYSVDKAGYVLSALLGSDLNTRLSSIENAGYITQSALAPYALRSEIPSLEGYATLDALNTLSQTVVNFKSLFDSMFEKDSDGNIHAKLSLWSSGGITAGGVGSGGSGGGGGESYNRLDSWADYSADKSGWVLSALLGNDLNTRLISVENAGYITQSALAPYALRSEIPSLDGYATLDALNTLSQTVVNFKSLFDSMFEKDSDGNIHAKLSLWSSGGITAGGVGSGGSGGGGGTSYNRLDSWVDYSADKAGYVLSALLGKDLDDRVSALANAGYITASYLAPYALRSEIPSLAGYFLASNFTKANIKSTLGISDWALASAAPTIKKERLTNFDSATPWTAFYTSFQAFNRPAGANYFSGFTLSNIDFQGEDNTYQIQLALSHTGTLHTRYRVKGSFVAWRTLAFTSDIPTKLSQLTDDVVAGKYLSKSGGQIIGEGDYAGVQLRLSGDIATIGFQQYGVDKGVVGWLGNTGIRLQNLNGYGLAVKDSNDPIFYWGENGSVQRILLHSGNYTDYALPLSGGTVSGTLSVSSILRFSDTDGTYKILLQRDSSGNILFGGGFSSNNMYIDANVLRIRATESIFSRKVTAPSFIGNLTGNADSATKLATPRTIWGQSFDGTGNVSGDLEGLQNLIFADGYLGRKFSLTNSGGVFYQAPSGSVGWATNWSVKSNDGITSFGDLVGAFGVGDSLSYFYFGGEYNAPSIAIMPSGMIAIGGTTANEKLHVHGNGKFTGALTANSLTIGGATITYDSVNEALCVNGNMYALGGVTAGGAGISAYTSLEARVARLEQQLNIS